MSLTSRSNANDFFFPVRPIDLFRPFNDEFFTNSIDRVNFPAIDVKETKDAFAISANVPGYTKDQVTIQLHDNVLEISGHYDKEEEKKNEKYLHKERVHSQFTRHIPLPDTVNSDQVTANLKDGVLNVSIPKGQPKKKSITIQ
ncbi:putative heat-shock protein [Globomyces pollinis-pini]|nr:putative heat-shock protein [Globomyces pollinis-pini]